ncbi:SDR family oxidoreductase [Pelagicoccus mobilis]|uniref:SDR family oxidoreductase n=1 Tax=Pelagicoccus mobilis TaxID=415221 RepID=A0A934S0U4_9BACT|nr:SDR family oxidoreductase [Pelagicoccus mobilis]MBK1877038.1 SDR family oxidoreductase [Pelagicoccus mobilis]
MATILITGASRGIGLELACQYAEAGETVIATCREPDSANALKHLAQSHENVEIEALDVVDSLAILSLASLLAKRGTQLDLLINNAGVLVHEAPGEWTAEGFSATLETNAVAPAIVMQAFSKVMAEGGKMISISSGLGSFGLNIDFGGPTGTYAASKAALNMAICQLAPLFKAKGLVIAAFNPGWVKTDMGGQEAALTVEESVSSLRKSFESLSLAQSGLFFDLDGSPLPW